jgi:hypothetical protein
MRGAEETAREESRLSRLGLGLSVKVHAFFFLHQKNTKEHNSIACIIAYRIIPHHPTPPDQSLQYTRL